MIILILSCKNITVAVRCCDCTTYRRELKMTLFRNMKIRGKLFFGFFLVLAMTVFIAVFGIVNLGTVDTSYTLMLNFPSERYKIVNYIYGELMNFRRIVTQMAFHLGNVPVLNDLRNEAVQARDRLNQHMDRYHDNMRADTLIDPARRAELITEADTLKNLLHRYSDEVLDKMFVATRDGTVGDMESRARVDVIFDHGSDLYANIETVFRTLSEGAEITMNNRAKEIAVTTNRTMVVKSVLTAAGVILGLIIAIIISGMITNPVKGLTAALLDVANGDLRKRLPEHGMDEISQASHSYNQSMDAFGKMIAAIKNQSGDLADIGNNLASNMTETAAAMNEISSNIQSIKTRVMNQSASVTETNATMEQVTVNIDKLNGHVERQTGAVAQASSAIEEMIANIKSVTAILVKNAENVKVLQDSSESGKSSLQGVASDIQEIARESEGLLEINSVMENIASQTNLLSMNAAIEAAHAGDAGRGFAVVADEIRKLAESSGEQSKTIGTVLKKIKESIDKITRSTDSVLNKFEAIERGVEVVSEQSETIRNAMEEQSHGSKQVLFASGQVSEITRQVKTGSDEMLEGSKEVIQESKNLEMVTQEITNGINEMAAGAEQVNKAVNTVNDLTGRTRENIATLAQAVSGFKV